MYRLLIVEDEKRERDSLYELITTHFSHAFEVDKAANATDAIAQCHQQNYDVIISDINLPMMNGLDFIAHIKTFMPQTLVYMLTSYHYFQYGMRAMELKVKDFLLKPIQWETLQQCLNDALQELSEGNKEAKLKQKMEEVKVLLEKDLVYAMIEKKEDTYIQHLFDILECKPKGVFAICGNNMEAVKQWAKQEQLLLLQARYYDTYVGYVILEKIYSQKQYNIWSEWFLRHRIRFGSIHCAVCDYALSFEEAMHQPQTTLKYYLASDEHANIYFQKLLEQIRYAIYKLDESLICYEEQRFIQQNENLEDTTRNMRMEQLHIILNQAYGGSVGTYQKESDLFQPIYQMIEMMKEHTQDAILLKNGSLDEQVAKALRYISMHFDKKISLNDLAEYLQLTPFYVSRLLKEKTGVTFSEILTHCRIQHAKKLLLQKDASIVEISKSCGFLSTNYFVKVFRKMTGKTPKEYMSEDVYEDISH